MSDCLCQTTRRGFLVGCSAAIAGLAGSRFNSLAFAQDGSYNEEILVVLFLRGGQDGLNLVVPTGGADRALYESLRPSLAVPAVDAQAHPLGSLVGGNGATEFGLHPSAAPLHELFVDQKLAVVVGCGMAANERSHFDSMNWMELGTPGYSASADGWITRHLSSATNLPGEILMPSISVGSLQAVSQLGSYETIAMSSPDQFALNTGPWSALVDQRQALRNLLESDASWVHQASLKALDAADIVELYAAGDYAPSPGVTYPAGPFGENLQTVAQMIRLDLGLRVATLDLGGWDHHESQAFSFEALVDELARGLQALWADLAAGATDHTPRLSVVVMSEFGRRLGENPDQGTDHGHGNNLLVLSGKAVGGLHGSWPGLAAELLSDGDLEVTTDFRRVLSEIVAKRLGNPRIDLVFPGYVAEPYLGVVTGEAPEPGSIFSDGFDDGDLDPWVAVPG
jgi:uncharacterized protein (DUF1501 family)